MVKALNGRDILTVPSLMCPGHQAIAGSLIPPSKVVSFPQRKGPLLPPEGRGGRRLLISRMHALKLGHTCPRERMIRSERPPSTGPDIRAAPLSEVKKTKVFLSIPRLCSDNKMRPTQWSSSITASPYLREHDHHTVQLKTSRINRK